jgi:hypothetical protein
MIGREEVIELLLRDPFHISSPGGLSDVSFWVFLPIGPIEMQAFFAGSG